MAEFFASSPRGLNEALEKELIEIGVQVLEKTNSGVYFSGTWRDCYKVNLCSRLASRILKPVLDFVAYQPDELYLHILKHDFTKYIEPTQTLTVDVSVQEGKMHDQRFIAMKVKDAIVDQFREKFGVRPDIDNRDADLRINVRSFKNNFSVSIDTSGDSLFQRGYRREVVEAPLKENLAAGLLKLTEWDGKSPLVDFMCGSGTFLIEGAMMALNMAPGIHRKSFGFMNFKNFDSDLWSSVIDEAIAQEKEELDFKFYGFDIDRRAIIKAKENAKIAGVDHVIEFKREPVATIMPPVATGMVVINPPYGTRVGEEDNLRDVYRDLSYTLKNRFKGWDCWVLSGNRELIADLKLKSTRKHFVFNGNLECRFLKYSMF